MSQLQETANEWVRRTCAEQGIPVHVTDDSVIRQVASILGCATTSTLGVAGRRKPTGYRQPLGDHAAARGDARQREGAADEAGSPEKQV